MIQFLKPTKWKVILAILIFILYVWLISEFTGCLDILKSSDVCVIDQKIPGANPIPSKEGKYTILGKRIPFSCERACTNSEYYSILVSTIFIEFIIPFLVIYLIVCLLFLIASSFSYIINKFKK